MYRSLVESCESITGFSSEDLNSFPMMTTHLALQTSAFCITRILWTQNLYRQYQLTQAHLKAPNSIGNTLDEAQVLIKYFITVGNALPTVLLQVWRTCWQHHDMVVGFRPDGIHECVDSGYDTGHCILGWMCTSQYDYRWNNEQIMRWSIHLSMPYRVLWNDFVPCIALALIRHE